MVIVIAFYRVHVKQLKCNFYILRMYIICTVHFFFFVIVTENLSIDATNLGTSQTLHADESGTITLPHYSGDQTLTPVCNFNCYRV